VVIVGPPGEPTIARSFPSFVMMVGVMLLNIVAEMPKFSLSIVEGKRGSFSGVPLLGDDDTAH